MSKRIKSNTIWGRESAPYRCEHCRREEATLFVSMKYTPNGQDANFYLCGRCYMESTLQAIADRAIQDAWPDIVQLGLFQVDPIDAMLNETRRKARDDKN